MGGAQTKNGERNEALTCARQRLQNTRFGYKTQNFSFRMRAVGRESCNNKLGQERETCWYLNPHSRPARIYNIFVISFYFYFI
jgi:hypothetical protein